MPSKETMEHVIECAKNSAASYRCKVIADYAVGKVAECPIIPFAIEYIDNVDKHKSN